MDLVLDASVTLAWSFDDEQNSYADGMLTRLTSGQATAAAPPIWPAEVVNGLLIAERRGRHTADQTTRLVADISQLPVAVETGGLALLGPAVLTLARAHNLSIYDAIYLELALRLGLPLATVDTRLSRAAPTAGVAIAE